MKTTFAKISTILASAIVVFSISGCKKEVVGYYKLFGLEEMTYIIAEEETAVEFFTELGNVISSYDGTVIIESSLVSDIEKVVKKYDNGVVAGTFELKRAAEEDGPWSTVKSWTMKFSSEYNVKSEIVSAKALAEEILK